MLKFLRVLIGLLLIASVIASFTFSQYYLRRTAEQFRSDFEHQNFAEISQADTFSLTQRLNALSRSESWRCIVGRRNGAVFFQFGDASCKTGFLEKSVKIVSDSADGQIEVRLSLGLGKEIQSALLVLIGIQIIIFLAVMQLTRKSDQLRHEAEARVAALATQVSHDIRSPLAALISIANHSSGLDETTRVHLRSAANRIRDIANQLLYRHREKTYVRAAKQNTNESDESLTTEEFKVHLLSAIIESVLSQKRLQYAEKKDIILETAFDHGHALFSSIQTTEFSRVLSNLIDNSIEALLQPGVITVYLCEDQECASIRIHDSGKGIPKNVLEKLGIRGETYGKAWGSGLGVYHAKKTVEAWGGKFQIESNVGIGTEVTLLLPKTTPPNWFVNSISWKSLKTIIVLDDDSSIHEIWENRFRQSGLPSTFPILHFYAASEILDWFRTTGGVIDKPLFLCDYELTGSNQTGLEIADILGVCKDCILVTNSYEELPIQERCEKLKVKLLPKPLITSVPLYD